MPFAKPEPFEVYEVEGSVRFPHRDGHRTIEFSFITNDLDVIGDDVATMLARPDSEVSLTIRRRPSVVRAAENVGGF